MQHGARSTASALRPRWRRAVRVTGWTLGAVLLWVATLAGCIVAGGQPNPNARADAALVLGAAVWNGQPSPVFAERIHHAITLYQRGQVRSLVFTGGVGSGDTAAEGTVAARYAIARGVPAEAVLVEAASRTTWDNLALAQPLLAANGLRPFRPGFAGSERPHPGRTIRFSSKCIGSV